MLQGAANPPRFMGSSTRARRAHRTSRQREARLRLMVEGLPVPFSVMAASDRISAMNAAGVELLGARLEEVVGQNLVGFVPSDEQEAVAAFLQRVCDRESGVLTHTLIGVDGRRRPVRIHAVQLLGPGGSAAMAVIQDDTDHYQLQQATREARSRFTRLAERTDAAVFMCQDARLWFANRPLEDLTGYTVEELQDIDLATLVPPDDLTVFQIAEPAMEAGRGTATPTELTPITKHGERVRLEATVTGVLHQGRAAALVIARQPGDTASRPGTSARDDEGASKDPGTRGRVLLHALAAAEARCEQLSAEHAKERERLDATRRLAEIYRQTLTQEHAAERRQLEDRLKEVQARHAERMTLTSNRSAVKISPVLTTMRNAA